MKRCSACGIDKLLAEFHKKTPTTYQSACKSCRKVYVKGHYEANKVSYIKRSAIQRKRQQLVVAETLRSSPCLDCGGTFPYYVMQFDHVRGEKRGSVTRMIGRVSQGTLDEELAKCEVVCANCHAIRTYRRLHSSDGRAAVS